jgi:hypothetical protein
VEDYLAWVDVLVSSSRHMLRQAEDLHPPRDGGLHDLLEGIDCMLAELAGVAVVRGCHIAGKEERRSTDGTGCGQRLDLSSSGTRQLSQSWIIHDWRPRPEWVRTLYERIRHC